MTFGYSRTAVSLIALCCSAAGFAGDEPIYRDAPDWVQPADIADIERDPSNSQIINDRQIRISEGMHWQYQDIVLRVASLADLSKMGTITAQWLPDKGDLIIHEISILRDGETIDLVAQGETMEVLRRERGLERRVLDGSLTATMSVPGLEVGDELRLSYSVTRSDQALGNEVQSQAFLYREPNNLADFARIRASWPKDLDVQYKAAPNFELAEVEQSGGYNWLEVSLPLEEADEFPSDAPLRYRRGTILQIGTFADWAEVSSTMAPYYQVDGALAELPDLLARVEAIRSEYSTDLERAVASLELVQEDIRYLLNGLDGGNYLPQDVATTWDKKYGDCKAKTVILLAILKHLEIDGEAVLVSTRVGNAVPMSLPIPGAFDHVLVRAQIDGNDYYLDGTSLGANLNSVGNVPGFEYALPIQAEGAELEPIEQVLPRYPDYQLDMAFNGAAGGDLPALLTLKASLVGPQAAQMNAYSDKLTSDNKQQLGRRFASKADVLDVQIVQGSDDSEATVIVTGLLDPIFTFDGSKMELDPFALSDTLKFAPNRSRRAWREIPYAVGIPSRSIIRSEMILPADGGEFSFEGERQLEFEVGGRRYLREVKLADRVLSVSEELITQGGEIQPEAFRAERRKASSLARNDAKLVGTDNVMRKWRFATGADRDVLKPLQDAYAQLIENKPDEADSYLSRAGFRYDTYDFTGALEDMNTVIELEPTAEYHSQRSSVHSKLLDLDASVADLEEAYALDPTPWRAMHLANELIKIDDFDQAREILEYEDGDEAVRQELAFVLAELDALQGDAEAGFWRITDLELDSPNDSNLLNTKCWFMGTWQVNIEDGVSVCTKAVENSGKAAAILDSRAMIFLRNGMLDEALTDINAALDLNPGLTASVLLRGLIRLERGDKGGQSDIDDALARDPEIGLTYRRWGFDL
ncbi:MAG: DUF3857 domain-containing protein [Erythrobacter sp.]